MPEDVLKFWFEEIDSKSWWRKDEHFDETVRFRFGDLHKRAAAGELFDWRQTADGALAEIIVLDQFSRNIHRNAPESFVNDSMALVLSQVAIANGLDNQLPDVQRAFLYMPFMHSESKQIHVHAEKLFQTIANRSSLQFELKHKAIIDRFGRYPHRNQTLGRSSTPEEIEFLKQPGSSF